MPRQRQRSPRTWTTTSRGRACGGARGEPTPTSHGSRATTARAPTTARAAATSSAMHPSQAAVAACEGKHLPGVNGSPHLAPRTTVLCARGAGRALVMGRNHAVVDRHEGSSGGRSRHQTRHRWCLAIRIGHEQWPISREMATNNGPFQSMGQRNGPFPENGLEQWPISRRWQIGVTHVAQTARRLRQASRQQEPQPGSAMTCCAPRTYPLHPGATVVATDYRPAVVGATSRQRQPWTRCPCRAKDWRSA